MNLRFELKNKLKIARASRNLTQAELADMVGVSRQTVISIEKGDYIPSSLLALTIAKVLEVDINEVFYLLSVNNERENS